jgi:RimJ/RimL family protein N-acetyltransferase
MGTPALVYLRALDEGDLERTLRWHNDPELYATLGDTFRFVGRAAEAEWLRRKTSYLPNEVNVAICLREDGEHVGNAYLRDIDWVSRRATLHIFLSGTEHRGKGYGRQAVQLLLQHAFAQLNLHRIELMVLADNLPAIRAYERCGFQTEGRLRQNVFKRGAYADSLIMSVLAADVPPVEDSQ